MTRTTGVPYLDGSGPVLALAHRGGSYHPGLEGLENTMEAFRHAVDLGYRYLETDVHATRDGVLLAFHDDVLDRVTDRVGVVASVTDAQIREARIGGRAEIPRFAELLESLPESRFNVDLKSDGAVPLLARLLLERSECERVLVGSFSRRRLHRFRRLTGGRVPTSAHPWEVAAFRLLPTPLARRLAGAPVALQVPHRRGRLTIVTPGFVRRAHAAGKHVHVWTIDDPDEMRELLDRGVDGLVSDRTDVLKDVLTQRRLWREHP